MKKFLSLLLALICVFACLSPLPIEAQAATEGYYTYEISNGQATITDVDTKIGDAITIPSTLGGYPVTAIGNNAFNLCTSLTSVTIPDSVTSIGDSAFESCYILTWITIPDSVISIGTGVFSDCSNLLSIVVDENNPRYSSDKFGVLFNKEQTTLILAPGALSSYTIPDGVTTIEEHAFYDCSSLSSVTIPDSVTTIGEGAFEYCRSLTSVTIPDGITSVEGYTFYCCSGLTSVTIPDSVTSIGKYAFNGCHNMTSISIPDSVTSIGDYAFDNCAGLTDVYYAGTEEQWEQISIGLNDSLMFTTIHYEGEDEATLASKWLNYTIEDGKVTITGCDSSAYGEMNIPKTIEGYPVTDIGAYAFSWRRNLTSITIPDSVTSIGDSAFYSCSSLTGVHISNLAAWCNIYFNGSASNPLYYAHNLYLNGELVTNLVIPHGVTSIAGYAFSGCTSLTSVTIPDSVTEIDAYAFYGCFNLTGIWVSEDSLTYSSDNSGVLFNKEQTKLIQAPGALPGSYTIPDSVTSIENSAFEGCARLTSITIPNSVTSIGDYAFRDCSSLTSITISDSVTSIGSYAFSCCISLTSVTIPDSVTEIDADAFYGCLNLTGIWVSEDSLTYSSDNSGVLFNKEQTKLIQAPYALPGSYTIPDSVTSIENSAFKGCTRLTSIDIPNSVTSFGGSAFLDCTSLTSVIIPDSVTDIPALVFSGCTSLTSVTIPDSVISMGYSAFSDCTSLTTVTIPDSVISIGIASFDGCTSLTSVTIPDSVTGIGNSAFYNCTSLTSVIIPNSVTDIPAFVFAGCTSLTSVTIPDSVISIGYSAFSNCASLTSVTIPDSVTSLESYAFFQCDSLTSITIPDSVTNIGECTFYFCTNLTSLIIPDSVTSIGDLVFHGCSKLTDVYYTGTQEQWEQIIISEDNDPLINATIHFEAFPEENFVNGKVDSWGVVLKENIGVSFQMKYTDKILADTDAYVEIVADGLKTTIPVSQAIESVSAELNAAQMTEPVTLTVVAGDGTRGESQTYTVRQYAQYILNGDYDDATKQLIKEMVNYGAAAQVYFDYDAENLANDGITDVAATDVPKTAEKVTVSDQISNVNFYGASLVYRDRIAVRYYFTGDVTGCTFTANGNTYTPVAKDGMHYVEIADILPQNLDQQITLTVTDANGNTLTAAYSPMNYIVRMNEKGSNTLKALVKALYNYHLAAKAL